MKRPAQKPFIVKQSSHPNIGGLKVSQAAQFLKVSPTTLRRYETEGKIQAQRDLSNNYRFYKVEDVRKLKDLLDNPVPARTLLGTEFSALPTSPKGYVGQARARSKTSAHSQTTLIILSR